MPRRTNQFRMPGQNNQRHSDREAEIHENLAQECSTPLSAVKNLSESKVIATTISPSAINDCARARNSRRSDLHDGITFERCHGISARKEFRVQRQDGRAISSDSSAHSRKSHGRAHHRIGAQPEAKSFSSMRRFSSAAISLNSRELGKSSFTPKAVPQPRHRARGVAKNISRFEQRHPRSQHHPAPLRRNFLPTPTTLPVPATK